MSIFFIHQNNYRVLFQQHLVKLTSFTLLDYARVFQRYYGCSFSLCAPSTAAPPAGFVAQRGSTVCFTLYSLTVVSTCFQSWSLFWWLKKEKEKKSDFYTILSQCMSIKARLSQQCVRVFKLHAQGSRCVWCVPWIQVDLFSSIICCCGHYQLKPGYYSNELGPLNCMHRGQGVSDVFPEFRLTFSALLSAVVDINSKWQLLSSLPQFIKFQLPFLPNADGSQTLICQFLKL